MEFGADWLVTEGAELYVKHFHEKIFQVGGVSLEVKSDLPITRTTFASKFDSFEIPWPLEDNVVLHHRFSCDLSKITVDAGKNIYFKPPWAIYHADSRWIYQWIKPEPPHKNYYRTVVTDKEHSFLDIYNDQDMEKKFLEGDLTSLTMFPTDQILLSRLLAYRKGCIMHSLGISLDGTGFLFVGHSDAGKSTMAQIMKKGAVILCDDRNIIRRNDTGYTLSGTWSHGDVPDVSAMTVPLKAIFFLEKSDRNSIQPVQTPGEVFDRLLACLIRPLETRDWWDMSLSFLTAVSRQVPCCHLEFNKTGQVYDLIKTMVPMKPDTIYTPSEKVICRDIMGKLVIVPIESGIADFNEAMYSLNDTGSLVWKCLEEKKSVARICSAVAREYEAETALIEQDVKNLLQTLLEKGMIVEWRN